MEAALALAGYFGEMVTERRRARPTDDLTSALLDADLGRGPARPTTRSSPSSSSWSWPATRRPPSCSANAWYWAWRFPDERAKAFADPGRVPDWVEETLRFDTSTQMLLRVTTGDVDLRGTVLPDGRRVLLLVGSANRDSRRLPRPDRYDLDRDTSKLISFGSGRHFCLGAALARLEARVGLEELVHRVGRLRHRRRRGPSGSTPSTCGASPPSRPRCRRSERRPRRPMSRYIAHPDRRPAVVTGASSGIGLATARALAAGGHPVVLGARRLGRCEEIARGDPARRVARRTPSPSTWPTATRSTSFAECRGGGCRRHRRSSCRVPGADLPARRSTPTPGASTRVIGRQPRRAPTELVRLLAPGMIERHHGDIVFVTSDVRALAPARAWRPTWRRSGASRVTSRTLQMELEGTGVRAIDRPTRSDPDRAWARTGTPRSPTEVLGEWVRWGLARHGHFLRPAGGGRRPWWPRSRLRVGTHLTMIEVQPEAPVRRDRPSSGGTP